MSAKPVYHPSQVLRMVKAGKLADPQPRGQGVIMCEAKRHVQIGDTESPSYWENGTYVHCNQCRGRMLARVEFRRFVIVLTGERKRYPLRMRKEQA